MILKFHYFGHRLNNYIVGQQEVKYKLNTMPDTLVDKKKKVM